MRLIDADALKIDYGFTWDDITPSHDEMYALIDRQPTIEERKTGRWIKNDNGTYSCSICQSWIPEEQHYYARYCLYCGANMEDKADAETEV